MSGFWRGLRQVVAKTVAACVKYRVTGLGAEAAFFGMLSLPPLVFGMAGAVGYVAVQFDVHTVESLRNQLIAVASQALTPDAVQTVIAPTLDDVLTVGRFSVVSIGFLIALWSGSRALSVIVDSITIMYGLAGVRGIIKTRLLSFALYLGFLVVGVLVLPLVLAGPTFVDSLLPERLRLLSHLYWPVVLLGGVCLLSTLDHVAVPVRTRWRSNLPGAVLTLVMWLGGSVALRSVLSFSAESTTIYGPLAAPIAVFIWLYISSLAVLIGAAFNSALDSVWPKLSGRPRAVKDRRKQLATEAEDA